MFGRRFYHESLRKVVVAFGTIFNNIIIHRTNSSGDVIQKIKVPLAYSPKEKFLTRLDQQASLDNREMAITLPRMGFEISGINYDPSRKLQRLGQFKAVNTSDESKMYYQYNPVPYNISFNLYSFTATAEGGLQIVEQILPYFQPDYTVTINAIPSMGIKRDVSIILNSVNYEDTYDGSFTQRRAVNYTLGFTAKTYLYGPVYSKKVIKETQADVYTDTDTTSESFEQRIIITPNPTSAAADDDFGYTTTIKNAESGIIQAAGTATLSNGEVTGVTITEPGYYTSTANVVFSAAPLPAKYSESVTKFGSLSYKSTSSAYTIATTGIADLQHGSVGFWFYVSDNYSGTKTIAEFGANDNDTEKYSVRLQESGGTVQAFLYFPLNATSSGTGASVLSNNLTTGEWHFLQLAQIDQAFNSRQVHLDNASSFATASYKGDIIDNNGFVINPDGNLSDGDVFFDEFYATTVNSEITLPTSSLSGQSGEVFFDGAEDFVRPQATGTVTITNNEVTGVTITDGGSDYTTAPTVTFTGN